MNLGECFTENIFLLSKTKTVMVKIDCFTNKFLPQFRGIRYILFEETREYFKEVALDVEDLVKYHVLRQRMRN